MNRLTMTHDVLLPCDESFERRINIVEIYIGDKAVDAGVDTGWLCPVDIALRGDEIGQHLQVGKPARECSAGVIAADALEVIALKIKFARLQQIALAERRLLAEQRVSECRPIALVLPA